MVGLQEKNDCPSVRSFKQQMRLKEDNKKIAKNKITNFSQILAPTTLPLPPPLQKRHKKGERHLGVPISRINIDAYFTRGSIIPETPACHPQTVNRAGRGGTPRQTQLRQHGGAKTGPSSALFPDTPISQERLPRREREKKRQRRK